MSKSEEIKSVAILDHLVHTGIMKVEDFNPKLSL